MCIRDRVFSFQPAMIPGYGMGNSLELNLQDMTGGELATFYEAAIQFQMCIRDSFNTMLFMCKFTVYGEFTCFYTKKILSL